MTNEQPEQPATPTLPALPPPPAEPSTPAEPARARLSPRAAGLIGLAVGVALTCSIWAIAANTQSGPDTFTLEGSFTLTEDSIAVDDDCRAGYDSGYDDIREGTSVTVYGAGGDVIGTGELGDSTSIDSTCVFDIAVTDVPKGEKFYKVEVSHRGTLQLTAEEAENGELAASLG